MEWALGAAAAVVLFLYGRSHSWWGGAAAPKPTVVDLEADMPDALKQAVLAQIASQTNPATLQAFATTMQQASYIQAAYALNQRAWVLSGSKGTAPTPPTTAQITAAQAVRALSGSNPANLGAMSLGQIQVAPGTPNLNINVGTMIGVVGATPYDATTNPTGYTVDVDATVATKMGEGVYAITAPGTIAFNWSPTSSTKLTATGASAATAGANAAANAAAAAAVGPAATSTPPATAANTAAAAASVPGLDPNSIQAAVDSLGNLVTTAATAAAVANVAPTTAPAVATAGMRGEMQ